MAILARKNGGISFKTLFWLSLLFVVVHVAVKVVPMYMDFQRMQDEMQTKANFSQVSTNDAEIQTALEKKARELDLPLPKEKFQIVRDADTSKIKKISTHGGWDVEMHFLWGAYVRTFHFEPVVESR